MLVTSMPNEEVKPSSVQRRAQWRRRNMIKNPILRKDDGRLDGRSFVLVSMPSKFPTGDVRIMCGSVLSRIALGPAPFISMERQTVSRTKDWHTCCGLCAASQE
jgi:hypothetical protein